MPPARLFPRWSARVLAASYSWRHSRYPKDMQRLQQECAIPGYHTIHSLGSAMPINPFWVSVRRLFRLWRPTLSGCWGSSVRLGWYLYNHVRHDPSRRSWSYCMTSHPLPHIRRTRGTFQWPSSQHCWLQTSPWGVCRRISSAYFPQSNRRAEVAVKTAKRIPMSNRVPREWQPAPRNAPTSQYSRPGLQHISSGSSIWQDPAWRVFRHEPHRASP